MSNDRMKPLMLAAVIGLMGTGLTGFSVEATLAQNPPKAAPEETPRNVEEKHDKAAKPVEETKPSEQTQDAAGGVIVPDYRDDRSTPQALIDPITMRSTARNIPEPTAIIPRRAGA
ncbi:hypothetical protein HED50_07110 [Ochrobactrum oryzae]|nr:hypothetical protein [Brucella oryzae]